MSILKKIFLILFVVVGIGQLKAQTVPVGTSSIEDYYRRMQLMGEPDSTISFTIRPLFSDHLMNTSNVFDPDSSLKQEHWKNLNWSLKSNKLKYVVLTND